MFLLEKTNYIRLLNIPSVQCGGVFMNCMLVLVLIHAVLWNEKE